VRVLIFLRVAQIQNHRERVAVRDVLPVRSARIGRQKMPLVRNDENVETVVQIENSRRGLVQTMLPDRTGRAATQDVHRVLEPNDERTLVQEQVIAGWRFVQQLLREGVCCECARAIFFFFFSSNCFLLCKDVASIQSEDDVMMPDAFGIRFRRRFTRRRRRRLFNDTD
jgi:hypothetical protein